MSHLDELRAAYYAVPAGRVGPERMAPALARLFDAVQAVLNTSDGCKELGAAYVECQRLLIEARSEARGAAPLDVPTLAAALRALHTGQSRWSYPVEGPEGEAEWIGEWLAVHHPAMARLSEGPIPPQEPKE